MVLRVNRARAQRTCGAELLPPLAIANVVLNRPKAKIDLPELVDEEVKRDRREYIGLEGDPQGGVLDLNVLPFLGVF